MAETEGAVVRFDGDQLCVDRRVQRAEDALISEAGDLGEQLPVEASTKHGGGEENGASFVADDRQPAPNAVGERQRHDRLDGVRQRPPVATVEKRTRRHGDRQEFLDKEGNPVGSLSEGEHLGRDAVGIQTCPHHVGHLGVGETSQLEDLDRATGLQHPGEFERCRSLLDTGRDQAQHPLGGEIVGQVLDDAERLRVGPVQVLENDDTSAVGQDTKKAQHALTQGDDGRLHFGLGAPPFGKQPAESSSERCELGRVGQPVDPNRRAQRFGQRAVGDRRLGLDSPTPDHHEATARGDLSSLSGESRLADPRLTEHEHDTAPPLRRRRDTRRRARRTPAPARPDVEPARSAGVAAGSPGPLM